MNVHFDSHGKDTAEKDRERLFTSAATNLASAALILIFNVRSLLFLEQNLCLRLINVGSHAIVFKSLCFGPFTIKSNPGVENTRVV